MKTITLNDLVGLLIKYNGQIILGSNCSKQELLQAEASERLCHENDVVLVWTPNIKSFPTTEEEVEFFERWYPLEEELPEELIEKTVLNIISNLREEARKRVSSRTKDIRLN